jgi:hypothetical protein
VPPARNVFVFLCQFVKAFGLLLTLKCKIFHSKEDWAGVAGRWIGRVSSEVLAGLLEELPKRIIIADIRELKKFSPRLLVGAFGVFR